MNFHNKRIDIEKSFTDDFYLTRTNPKKIIILDDEPGVRKLLKNYLSGFDYEIFETAEGLSFLEVFKKEQPDLAIVDLNLPGSLSGQEIISEIKKIDIYKPIVVISGVGTPEDLSKAFYQGKKEIRFLAKPFANIQKIQEEIVAAWREAKIEYMEAIYQKKLEEEINIRTIALKTSEEKFSKAFHSLPVVVVINELKTGKYLEVNQYTVDQSGYSREEFLNSTAETLNIWADKNDQRRLVQLLMKNRVVKNYETVFISKNGQKFSSVLNAEIFVLNNREYVVLGAVDISELKATKQRIEYLQEYDELTNFYNQKKWKKETNLILKRNKNAAVICLEISTLSEINQYYGFHIGDEVLKKVAEILSSTLRENDYKARFGDNEFMIFLTDIPSNDEPFIVSRKIQQSLLNSIVIEGKHYDVKTSIGISIFPNDSTEMEVLITNSQKAMALAKEEGGYNKYRLFNNELDKKTRSRFELWENLQKILANKEQEEIFIVYQPKVDRTGQIIGYEVLLRWLGVSTEELISLAESKKVILQLDNIALAKACQDLNKQPLKNKRISVNISAQQFDKPELLVASFSGFLKNYNISPELIDIEITESDIIKKEAQAIEAINTLRALGITISMDDFGKEHSSLIRLPHLPIDTIKIDKIFIQNLGQKAYADIVAAIIDLGHKLNKKVLAEGVETEEQLRFLLEVDCDEFQGYLFSKPVIYEELAKDQEGYTELIKRNLRQLI